MAHQAQGISRGGMLVTGNRAGKNVLQNTCRWKDRKGRQEWQCGNGWNARVGRLTQQPCWVGKQRLACERSERRLHTDVQPERYAAQQAGWHSIAALAKIKAGWRHGGERAGNTGVELYTERMPPAGWEAGLPKSRENAQSCARAAPGQRLAAGPALRTATKWRVLPQARGRNIFSLRDVRTAGHESEGRAASAGPAPHTCHSRQVPSQPRSAAAPGASKLPQPAVAVKAAGEDGVALAGQARHALAVRFK